MRRGILLCAASLLLAGCNADAPPKASPEWLITQKVFHMIQKLDDRFVDTFNDEIFDMTRDHYAEYNRIAENIIAQQTHYDAGFWCEIVRKRIKKESKWVLGPISPPRRIQSQRQRMHRAPDRHRNNRGHDTSTNQTATRDRRHTNQMAVTKLSDMYRRHGVPEEHKL